MSRRDYESPKSLGFCEVGVEAVEKRIRALSDDFLEELECLDISQNGFGAIPVWLERCPNLRYLDLSVNSIEKLERLEDLTKLRDLHMAGNCIKKVEGLDSLKNLIGLRLGESFHYKIGNEISKIENLESLTNLKALELANNKLEKIEGLDCHTKLEFLELSSNQIKRIEGLEKSLNLKVLYLRDNSIQHLDLSKIPTLERFDISGNPIQKITGFGALKRIKSLFIDLDTCDPSSKIQFHEHFRSLGQGEYCSKAK